MEGEREPATARKEGREGEGEIEIALRQRESNPFFLNKIITIKDNSKIV